jgi:uncharacterized protein (DUF1330 family)
MLDGGKRQEGTVAKGYWVAQVDVTDMDAYKLYIAANSGPIGAFGGKYIIRNGQHVNVEGSMRQRIVVIEFPSYQAALDCYASDAYQAIRPLRTSIAQCDITVIEGLGG